MIFTWEAFSAHNLNGVFGSPSISEGDQPARSRRTSKPQGLVVLHRHGAPNLQHLRLRHIQQLLKLRSLGKPDAQSKPAVCLAHSIFCEHLTNIQGGYQTLNQKGGGSRSWWGLRFSTHRTSHPRAKLFMEPIRYPATNTQLCASAQNMLFVCCSLHERNCDWPDAQGPTS